MKNPSIPRIINIYLYPMQLLSPLHWKDYELMDVGAFEKLERFGNFITIRPEPQAVWDRSLSLKEWEQKAHVRFEPRGSSSGEWKMLRKMPEQWQVRYAIGGKDPSIRFRLGLTSFKHVGIFPEQASNWEYIYDSVNKLKPILNGEAPRFLNLFAYTGGASLAAKAAGADVTHVDSIKQVVSWARENMDISELENIRWVVEDALKFVKREQKRGNKYNGIILDPPAFGHGPNGEKWKLEDNINEMMKGVLDLLDPKGHFMILNAYSLGFSSLIIENLMKGKAKEKLETGELFLQATAGNKLPLGVFGRFRSF
jgi:23S rRNA (cytosine1962-C5)-methyltransferase